MSRTRNPRAGLFTGYWTDGAGRRIRRIRQDEYPELYRLHRKHTAQRLGVAIVGMAAPWTLGRATTQTHRETGPDVGVALPNVYSANYGNLHPGAS